METAHLIPVRMVNEFVYCPRLAYLEWIQNEWADSADTDEGRRIHRRVDRKSRKQLPEADNETEAIHSRSVDLGSARLGIIARLDLVEGEGRHVTPVDYKRGKRPHVARGAYDPERVQLCLQAMLLEEHGYECIEGIIYYAASRERVRIPFDRELRDMSLAAVEGLRSLSEEGEIPPPLEDSPKCPRCSLVGICLPDEISFLHRGGELPRPLFVARDDALPVYVQSHRGAVRKRGETLVIEKDGALATEVPLNQVSMLVLHGNIYTTTPCIQELLRRNIPVCWHGFSGWFHGFSMSSWHGNVELRTAQYRASFDIEACLRLARSFVRAKILNCRTMLRRNWRGEDKPGRLLIDMKEYARRAMRAKSLDELLGVEGSAAGRYFGAFSSLLKNEQFQSVFDEHGRRRRPPPDPVNAMLSYGYALLARAWTVTLTMVGFDPMRGFYHKLRYGRPSLALDMMESFRPLIVDSSLLQVINNGEVDMDGFVYSAGSCAMKERTRKKLIAAFERRMGHEITHPLFGYRVSYRRLLELQSRLLGRYLLGELQSYPDFTTR